MSAFLRIIQFSTLILLSAGCGTEYYTIDDFQSVKKIDTHVHLNSLDTSLAVQAGQDNFLLLTVNVDAPSNVTVEEQREFALHQVEKFPNDVKFLTAFTLQNWSSENWANEIIAQLETAFDQGALGIKLWKNIGMVYKDSAGQFIMVDDPKFDPVINYIIKKNKTVMAHIGEPKNCWLPLEKMTVNNDRNYFKNHPEYHMYLHPEYPSYDAIIAARDRFVEKHPDMRFVGAHLGSLEWDVDELAKRLDRFPNMAVDVAARVPHLQFQSQSNREKVRDFLIKYKDRIIYATDEGISKNSDPAAARKELHDHWMRDWKYFATDEKLTVPEVNGEFQGLQLPRDVINSIYHDNAVKWFGIAQK
jgi:predicted TIM-barrel fold metal-dependent hydrolase